MVDHYVNSSINPTFLAVIRLLLEIVEVYIRHFPLQKKGYRWSRKVSLDSLDHVYLSMGIL
jgi:hypothetical protein